MPDWYYIVYFIIVIISAMINVLLCIYVWRNREVQGAKALFWTELFAVGWLLGLILEIAHTSLEMMLFWNNVRFSLVLFISFATFIFILHYTGRESWLTWQRFLLLAIIPIVTVLLNWTDPWHTLVWKGYDTFWGGSLRYPIRIPGIWQLVFLIYNYVIFFWGLGILLRMAVVSKPPYRYQIFIVLAAFFTIIIIDLLSILQIIRGLSLSPIVNMFTNLLLVWAVFYHRLFDMSPVAHHIIIQRMRDGVIVLDEKKRIAEINPSAEHIIEMTQDAVIGADVFALFPDWREDSRLFSSDQAIQQEYKHQNHESNRFYDVQISPSLNRRNQLSGWIVVLRDVTERKQAEERLRKSEADLARAQDIAGLGGFYYNALTGIVVWSRQMCKIAGLEDEERHMTLQDVRNHIHPDDQEEISQAFYAVMHGEKQIALDVRLVRPDGSVRYLYDQFEAIYDAEGQALEIFGTAQDITERKHAEEVLREAQQAAESANRAKSTFLANMSHELRTPLNAMLGFARIMQLSPSTDTDQREYVNIIHRSGEHLLSLINDVLDMSKIESGHTTVKETSVEVYKMLDDIEQMFLTKASQKQLVLNVQCEPTVPRTISTDEMKLRQVLINLVSNAFKFTQHGSITVMVRRGEAPLSDAQQTDMSQMMLHCCVQDTGPGIAPEEQAMLFQPFSQTHTGQQSGEGTGLGLAISQAFVQLLGGRIEIESAVGKGTTFSFAIPVGVMEDMPITDDQHMQERLKVLAPGQPAYRILIVDDQWSNRQLLLSMLKKSGVELREASNGHEAVLAWETWNPHLIFLDIRMPVMDGYAVARHIRTVPEEHRTILVAVTADVLQEKQDEAQATGFDDYINKPFTVAQIFGALSKWLHVQLLDVEVPSDLEQEPTATSETLEVLHEEQLATAIANLPTELHLRLKQAVIVGDLQEIDRVIAKIQPLHRQLAEKLLFMSNQFQLSQILEVLEKQ